MRRRRRVDEAPHVIANGFFDRGDAGKLNITRGKM